MHVEFYRFRFKIEKELFEARNKKLTGDHKMNIHSQRLNAYQQLFNLKYFYEQMRRRNGGECDVKCISFHRI